MARSSAEANLQRPFLIFCGLLVVTAFLYWAQKVLIPVALAVLLAFVLSPFVTLLQRRGLRRVPAVLLVVVVVFALLGGVGAIILQQLEGLVSEVGGYRKNIVTKLEKLQSFGGEGTLGKIQETFAAIQHELVRNKEAAAPEKPATEPPGPKPGYTADRPLYVENTPSGWTRVLEVAGPAGEGLAGAFLVVVLVLFMLIQRENLRNRVMQLIGHGRVLVTTRAIDEGAQRISRYLLTQLMVNAGFGLTLTVGLFAIALYSGQPALQYTAVLWGFVGGSLKFVPYLGTWVAALLLFAYSFATLPGWVLPLVIFGYYMLIELVTANVIEPLAFGHSTGSSPIALLVAAAFWTWLWGPVGLVLSTPLTVVVLVLGKYVPHLQFLEVLLGDAPDVNPDVTFYQRLVARDQDEANDLFEDYLQTHTLEAAYSDLVLPALVLARHDYRRGELDEEDLDYLLTACRNMADDLETQQPELLATPPGPNGVAAKPPPAVVLLACPAQDRLDELALHLFRQVLQPQGYRVEVLSPNALAGEVVARIGEYCPPVVLVGALPPGGVAQARYLCKRIRSQCPTVKIAVGRWGDQDNAERVEKRLKGAGADFVAATLAYTRAQVVPFLQVAATTATTANPAVQPASGPVPAGTAGG